MNIKKLLITEIEKRNILSQYGIIVEEANPVTSLTIDKYVTFPGGYYSEEYLGKDLTSEVDKIQQFLKEKQGKSFLVDVILESGESQIPNTDNENGGKKVDRGFLAIKRNETIKKYITTQLQSFVDNKLLVKIPEFKIFPPKIGNTPWVGQPFCPKNLLPTEDTQGYECLKSTFKPGKDTNNKPIVNWISGKQKVYKETSDLYLKEQYIRVKIEVKELIDMKKCLNNMTIEVNYTDLGKQHFCNSAIYEIYIKGNLNKNSSKLTRTDGKGYASLNNDSEGAKSYSAPANLINYDNEPNKHKGKRYNKFIVTTEIAAKLISDGSTSFIISAKCINPLNISHVQWGDGCHTGVGNIVITNGRGETTEYNSETPTGKNQVKVLKAINACGGELVVKT